MADAKERFEFSSSVDSETVAKYLESLASQVRRGNAQLSAATRQIHVHFGSPIKVEVEAEMDPDEGTGSLGMSLSWKHPINASDARNVIEDGPAESEMPQKDEVPVSESEMVEAGEDPRREEPTGVGGAG